MAEGEGLVSVDYEVSGKVQGVFFRKYTQVRAGMEWDGVGSGRVLFGSIPWGAPPRPAPPRRALPDGVRGDPCQHYGSSCEHLGGAEQRAGGLGEGHGPGSGCSEGAVVSRCCWRPVLCYVSVAEKGISAPVVCVKECDE